MSRWSESLAACAHKSRPLPNSGPGKAMTTAKMSCSMICPATWGCCEQCCSCFASKPEDCHGAVYRATVSASLPALCTSARQMSLSGTLPGALWCKATALQHGPPFSHCCVLRDRLLGRWRTLASRPYLCSHTTSIFFIEQLLETPMCFGPCSQWFLSCGVVSICNLAGFYSACLC